MKKLIYFRIFTKKVNDWYFLLSINSNPAHLIGQKSVQHLNQPIRLIRSESAEMFSSNLINEFQVWTQSG